MFTVIILFTALLALIVIYATNKTGEHKNGNVLLGVTLPAYAMDDSELRKIVQEFHRAHVRNLLALLLLLCPLGLVGKYISVSLLYLLVWMSLLFYLNQRTIKQYFHRAYELKQRNGWLVGERHSICIDTIVSREKSKFPVSRGWFFLPLCISLLSPLLLVLSKSSQAFQWILAGSGIFIWLLSFMICLAYRRNRTVAYSQNTEVNLLINRIYYREWSKCWLLVSLLGSITGLLSVWIFLMSIDLPMFFMIYSCMTAAFIVVPVLMTYDKIRLEKNRLLQLDEGIIYTDDDQYWEKGYYDNPNDSRTVIEKRWGYGTTVNMARPIGKVSILATLAALLVIVFLAFYLMPLDFGSISLTIAKENVEIKAPLMAYSFPVADVKAITILDKLPQANKRMGGDSEMFLVGKFDVAGYGVSEVYVRRDLAPYIGVELTDKWVFLNGNTKEQTEEFFERLTEQQKRL